MPPPQTPALNGNGVPTQGPDGTNGVHKEPKFASGLILPPPEIKCEFSVQCCVNIIGTHLTCLLSASYTAVIDRTALFVARSANPPQFEEKIRENQRQDPKFAFLNPADPYHAYYRHRMDKVVRGELEEETAPKEAEKTEEKPVETAPVDLGEEPPIPEFILNIPNITAIDLCVPLQS